MAQMPPELCMLAASLDGRGVESEVSDVVPSRQAAVLVLLFPSPDGIRFYLTCRPMTLKYHPGQISLPGGGREPSDSSLWQTAIRETGEELGITVHNIARMGKLADVHVQASGNCIAPFVGWTAELPVLSPDPAEVAAVRAITLRSLLDPGNVREERWHLRGAPWQVAIFDFDGWHVWGATARILADLRGHLRPDLRSRHPQPGSVSPV